MTYLTCLGRGVEPSRAVCSVSAFLRSWIGVCLVVLATGCSSTKIVLQPNTEWLGGLRESSPLPASLAIGFPAADADLSGRSRVLTAGDRLIFEIRITDGSEETLNFLSIEVLGPSLKDGRRQYQTLKLTKRGKTTRLTTLVHSVSLMLLDEQGEILKESTVQLAEGTAQDHTFACSVYADLDPSLWATRDELRKPVPKAVEERIFGATGRGIQSLAALFGLAQDDKLLSELLWDVIEKPSLASVALHMGVNLNFQAGYNLADPIENPMTFLPAQTDCWNLPISIALNNKAALDLNLAVVQPTPPYTITGGILAFEGHHPTRDIAVRAKLVGAQLAKTTP